MGEAAPTSYGGGGAGDQGPTQAMLEGGGSSVSPASMASIAGLGLSAYSTIAKGQGAKSSYEAQADRAARAAEFGKLQAEQTDLHFRDELNTTLGNIDVIRAAAHIDPTSPTTAAVEDRQRMLSDRQRMTSLLSIKSQVSEDEASSAYLRKAGDFALTQSYIKAGVDAVGAVGKAFAMGA